MTLDQYLGAIYRERVISGGADGDSAARALREALADDPILNAEAMARLETLRLLPEQRCFVSAQHRKAIEEALAALAST
jgi:hypothetical protein